MGRITRPTSILYELLKSKKNKFIFRKLKDLDAGIPFQPLLRERGRPRSELHHRTVYEWGREEDAGGGYRAAKV